MRENARANGLVVLFSLVYYVVLTAIFVQRVPGLRNAEWKLAYPFRGLLIPFTVLWVWNLMIGSNVGRLITGLP